MDYNSIAVMHAHDPAIAALRKEGLPLVISFLYQAFKQQHRVTVPQELLREQLDTYLDHVNASLPEKQQHRASADEYINRWSRDDDLLRIRVRDEGYVIQLSPHAERLLGWFEEMQNKRIIGTESRLRNILSLLNEVVTRSTEDVETRLQQLYDKRDAIEAEITRIEETRQIDGLSDGQIREWLDLISGMARQLLGDFSLVEERFREMARTIQQAQLNPDARRGDILATALDANEQLEQSDEGLSFRAFYELLTHPQERKTFDALINAVFTMPRLATFADDHIILQRLTSHLLEAGERVNQSNRRLAEHLRRVVDTRHITESRRVQTLAHEIKYLVSRLDDELYPLMQQRRQFFRIEGDPDVELPLERPLFDPPQQIEITGRPRAASSMIDPNALLALYDTFYIDRAALQDNIKRALMSRPEITLAELVQSYPVRQGMAEVVAYLLIAANAAQHRIERHITETIDIYTTGSETPHLITVPRIIFCRQALPEEQDV